ncbi:MAG: hypothetical protein WDL87_04865 [Candidatus Omnitrophota bacterium]|jgi:hypothetical protein
MQEILIISSLLSVVAMIFTWPLILHFAQAIPQGSLPPAVAMTQLFCAQWTGKALDKGISYWNAPFYYPFPGAFAWGETQPFSCLFIWLVAKLTGYIFAYNLLIMLYMVGFGLVGYAASLLLTRDRIAALWAGIWLTAGAFTIQKLCVLPVLAAGFPTGCILFSFLFVKEKNYRYFWLAFASYVLTWLTCKQLALFVSVLLPFALFGFFSLKKLRSLKISHIVPALILLPALVLPYSLRQLYYTQAMGFERGLNDVKAVLSLNNLFLPAKGHWLITHILGWRGVYSRDIGVVAIAVIIFSLFLGIFKHQSLNNYQKKIIKGLAAVIIVGLFLGFGPSLKISIAGKSFSLYTLFFSVIPGMEYVRVPARANLFIVFGISLLSALALAFIRSRIKSTAKKLFVTAVFFVLLLAEMWTMPILLVFPGREISQHQRVIDWLRKQGGGSPVIELPIAPRLSAPNMELEAWAMYRMLRHGNPIINGYVSFFPVSYVQLKQSFGEESLGRFQRYLEAYGVKYAVVHDHKLSSIEKENLAPVLGNNIVYNDAEHSIYLLPDKGRFQDISQFLPPKVSFREGIIPQKGKTYRLSLPVPKDKAILLTPQLPWRISLDWTDETGKRRSKTIRMRGSQLVDASHPFIYFKFIYFPPGNKEAEAVLVYVK